VSSFLFSKKENND